MLRNAKKIIAVAALAVALAASGRAVAARDFEIMTVDEIKPGMKGYGLTVFNGAMPEKFDIEIVAVIKIWKTGNDLIIARCSGRNLEFTGTAAGMSGSPMFIDGKLIGALAYGWYWAKEAIAGVQPIEHMLELWDNPGRVPAGSTGGAAPKAELFGFLSSRGAMDSMTPAEISKRLGLTANGPAPVRHGDIELAPIKTPLLLSGFDSSSAALLRDLLATYNLTPVMGGGDADVAASPGVNDLQAGSVLGSPLMRGDLKAAAIGTVTVRDGDRLLGFGHPFFNEGPTSIPMSGGEIYHIMALQDWTYKIGAVGDVLGSIVDDRVPAVAGSIGTMPEFYTASIEITDESLELKNRYDVEIAQVRGIDALLLASAVGTAVGRSAMKSEATMKMVVDGRIEDYERPFHFEDMFVQPPDYLSFGPMLYIFDLVYNPFHELRLRNVRIRLTFEREVKASTILSASLGSSRFRAGDVVKAHLRLKPYDADERVRTIEFRIPQDTQPGPLMIEIEGGGSMFGMPVAVMPETFDQMFDALNNWIPQNVIGVKFLYPEPAVGLEGMELQNLPKSMQHSIVQGSNNTIQKPFTRYERALFGADEVVYGKAVVNITVEKEYKP